jgi:hypothetical protein
MIIIWGSSHFGKHDHSRLIDNCQMCGARVRLESYTARKFFTLYYIPLIPTGHERVIRFCGACKQYRSVQMKQLPECISDTEREGRRAVAEGRGEDAVGAAIFLGDLGAIECGQALVSEMVRTGLTESAAQACCVLNEMAGDVAAAADTLQRFIQQRPADLRARAMLGHC